MNTAWMEIILNLQKKYNKVNELQDVTKQMSECLQRNDLYAFELFVEMRTEIMLELDNLQYLQEDLLQNLSEEEQALAKRALTLDVEATLLENPDIRRMNEIYCKIKRSVESTIQYDKAISLKIGGDDSFYRNKGE
ncbi:hypothetical protein [Anaerotignum propionicum]|uniref:FlgN protein n=1 Tax=Anaerotignum propionicum DSM 1682 TaxID=991789 RepID=A0A0X8VEP9_ANAPI|nr:hypothetical protein [Anaerotignum propionicum]AMJ42370.1 hypothetical protein CPRO_28280 [Anaerotignum propionicum DSM 1682]MEA5058203.1 hypothetical protein [Anaerotignum propionicum]SHF00612.1 hypothetical protein SAMN02745151_02484 [[Clostridium] propionicum DSM 1682] [Anaerotignum propionicum DSM 1682]